MNKNLLLPLAIAAAVFVGIGVWLSGQEAPVTAAQSGGPLIEGLADRVNDITAVTVTDGDEQVTLEREGGVWHVAERDGYRADLSQLRRRLVALVEAKRLEGKTTNPERYAQLGVSDVSEGDDDDQNLKVAVAGPEGFDLIVGKRANASQGTYVRFADEAQSWLASGDLRFSANARDWLKKDLLDIPANRVRSASLAHSSGDRIELSKARPEDPNYGLDNLPDDREVLSPSAGNSIASAIAGLRFEDVAPASQENFQGLEIVQGEYETFDGLRVSTRAFNREDKYYVMLDVAFDAELAAQSKPEPSAPAADAEESDGEAADTEAGEAGSFEDTQAAQAAADAAAMAAYEESVAAAEAEAEALKPLTDGWVFEIPSYKHGNLTKSLEDLLKPLDDGSDADDAE
ncbi:MAG: DUF4340 domain-containing protein [Pseudomonadota bacterium]